MWKLNTGALSILLYYSLSSLYKRSYCHYFDKKRAYNNQLPTWSTVCANIPLLSSLYFPSLKVGLIRANLPSQSKAESVSFRDRHVTWNGYVDRLCSALTFKRTYTSNHERNFTKNVTVWIQQEHSSLFFGIYLADYGTPVRAKKESWHVCSVPTKFFYPQRSRPSQFLRNWPTQKCSFSPFLWHCQIDSQSVVVEVSVSV